MLFPGLGINLDNNNIFHMLLILCWESSCLPGHFGNIPMLFLVSPSLCPKKYACALYFWCCSLLLILTLKFQSLCTSVVINNTVLHYKIYLILLISILWFCMPYFPFQSFFSQHNSAVALFQS